MIEEGNPMSDTPEAERILKIAAFGFDRPEEAPLDDFPCCSDTELQACNSGTAQSGSEALARLLYRRLYGHEGYAPGIICRELADAILAAGWRPPVAADRPTEPVSETEYRARIGHIYGEERMTPAGAKDACLDVLADYPFEFEARYDQPVIYRRKVSPWEEIDTREAETAKEQNR